MELRSRSVKNGDYKSQKSSFKDAATAPKTAALSAPEVLPWWHSKRLRFYTFEQVPAYLQDNEFIRNGYRSGYSYKESFISLFHLHNESGNVWTHLIGVLLFSLLVAYTWTAAEMAPLHIEDKLVLTIFLGLAIYTVLFSTLLHLHLCVSEGAQQFWSCLDHSGISASIAGGSIAIIYLLLHCHGWMRMFWIGTLVAFNSVGILGPMFPLWSRPGFRVYRTVLYLCSGFATLFPVIYYLYHEGTAKLPAFQDNFAIGYVILMACQYVLGAFFYASRIPERFWPGKFDYFFQSHQIWHVLVVTATLTLWRGVIGFITWRMDDLEMCF
ncbi:hypothetical protein HDV03_004034 [Kappamyces sp. JEL0829]|nr:hypothetical protein HDV03_004034 [Kappamyces sp. JEL0829]